MSVVTNGYVSLLFPFPLPKRCPLADNNNAEGKMHYLSTHFALFYATVN